MRVKLRTRRSSSTSARWPALGSAFATSSRRHAYHSQTRRGFCRNASGVANSSGLNFSHKPVCASRNVGMPLSAEMPEPVSTQTSEPFRSASIKSVGKASIPFCMNRPYRTDNWLETVPDSRKGCVQNAVLFRGSHFAMPERKLVFQMTQASIHARGQRPIGELRLIGRPLHEFSPGQKLAHPIPVLFHRLARIVGGEMLCFPGAESRADLIPIIHSRTEISQHSGLEVGKLTNFKRQRSYYG